MIKEAENNTEEVKKEREYFYAVGRRKTSVAQAKIYFVKSDSFLVNGKKLTEYFSVARHIESAKASLEKTGNGGKFEVVVKVSGGGVNSQAEATRLAIARALVIYDETLRKSLKDLGYLKRDARKVERKKAGLKKARKSPQWAKR